MDSHLGVPGWGIYSPQSQGHRENTTARMTGRSPEHRVIGWASRFLGEFELGILIEVIDSWVGPNSEPENSLPASVWLDRHCFR